MGGVYLNNGIATGRKTGTSLRSVRCSRREDEVEAAAPWKASESSSGSPREEGEDGIESREQGMRGAERNFQQCKVLISQLNFVLVCLQKIRRASMTLPGRGKKPTSRSAEGRAAEDEKEEDPLVISKLGDMAHVKRVFDETIVGVRARSSLTRAPCFLLAPLSPSSPSTSRPPVSHSRSPTPLPPRRRAPLPLQAVLDMGYDEQHAVTHVKIFLGLVTIAFALFAQFYPTPFPENARVPAASLGTVSSTRFSRLSSPSSSAARSCSRSPSMGPAAPRRRGSPCEPKCRGSWKCTQ